MNKIKNSMFFRTISLILILTFISLDISYAYPPEHNAENSTLATPSPFQQNPINANAERFHESILTDGRILGSVCSIGKFLFEDGIHLKYLAEILDRELGDTAKYIDLSRVNVLELRDQKLNALKPTDDIPHNAIIRIPYDKDGNKGTIELALKDNLSMDRLAGYQWVISDKYAVKVYPSGYVSPKPAKIISEKERLTVSEPIAEVVVPVNKVETSEDVGKTDEGLKISIRAIFKQVVAIVIMLASLFTMPAMGQAACRALEPAAINKADIATREEILAHIKAFDSGDFFVRQEKSETLRKISLVNPEVVPLLIETLNSDNWYRRWGAAVALGKIGAASPEVVPALIKAIDDRGEYTRRGIAEALGEIGPVTPEVIPTLIRLLRDKNYFVSLEAAIALGRIGPAAKEALPGLSRLLRISTDYDTRLKISEAIRKIENVSPSSGRLYSFNPLAAALGFATLDSAFSVAKELAFAIPIFTLAVATSLVIAALLIAAKHRLFRSSWHLPVWWHLWRLESDNQETRNSATKALAKSYSLGEIKDPREVRLFVMALNDYNNNKDHRRFIVEALTAMGSPAIDVLKKVSHSSDPVISDTAREMLTKMAEYLVRQIPLNKAAPEALIEIGSPAVAPLTERLESKGRYAVSDPYEDTVTIVAGSLNRALVAEILGRIKDRRIYESLIMDLAGTKEGTINSAAEMLLNKGWKPAQVEEAIAYYVALGNLDELSEGRLKALENLSEMLETAHTKRAAAKKHEDGKNLRVSILPTVIFGLAALGSPFSAMKHFIIANVVEIMNIALWASIIFLAAVIAWIAYYHSFLKPELDAEKALSEASDSSRLTIETTNELELNPNTFAIDRLVALLENDSSNIRMSAITALGKVAHIVPEVIQPLVKALGDEDSNVRLKAIEVVGDIASLFPEIVPVLIKTLKDGNSYIQRNAAAEALGRIGPLTPEVVPALINALKSGNYGAATALGKIGPVTPEVVPALIKALNEDNVKGIHENIYSNIRWKAAEALGNIGPAAKEALPYLRQLLTDERIVARFEAKDAIRKIENGSSDSYSLYPLSLSAVGFGGATFDSSLSAVKDFTFTSPEVIDTIARASIVFTAIIVGFVGLHILNRYLKKKMRNDRYASEYSQKAVEDINKSDAKSNISAVPNLIYLLANGDSSSRANAATALGKIGPVTPEVTPALLKALGDEDTGVRGSVVDAFGEISSVTPEVVSALIKMLNDPDSHVQSRVAAAFSKIDPITPEAIAGLIAALENNNYEAVATLGKIHPLIPEIVTALMKALKEGDSDVRRTAALALGKIRPLMPEVTSALLEALKDSDSDVLGNIIDALRDIGPVTPEVIPAITKMLHYGDGYVRDRAAKALTKLGVMTEDLEIKRYITDLTDLSSEVRIKATAELKKRGVLKPEYRVKRYIVDLGNKNNNEVRRHAAIALINMQDSRLRDMAEYLKCVRKYDHNYYVPLSDSDVEYIVRSLDGGEDLNLVYKPFIKHNGYSEVLDGGREMTDVVYSRARLIIPGDASRRKLLLPEIPDFGKTREILPPYAPDVPTWDLKVSSYDKLRDGMELRSIASIEKILGTRSWIWNFVSADRRNEALSRINRIRPKVPAIVGTLYENNIISLDIPLVSMYIAGSFPWTNSPNDLNIVVIVDGDREFSRIRSSDLPVESKEIAPDVGASFEVVGLETLKRAAKGEDFAGAKALRRKLTVYSGAVPLAGIDIFDKSTPPPASYRVMWEDILTGANAALKLWDATKYDMEEFEARIMARHEEAAALENWIANKSKKDDDNANSKKLLSFDPFSVAVWLPLAFSAIGDFTVEHRFATAAIIISLGLVLFRAIWRTLLPAEQSIDSIVAPKMKEQEAKDGVMGDVSNLKPEEPAKASEAPRLFDISEPLLSSPNNNRIRFMETGNALVYRYSAIPDVDDANVAGLNRKMATAEIRYRLERAIAGIEAVEKDTMSPETRSAIETLRKDMNQFEADGGIASLIVLARKAKRENQKLIIGLETDWIPAVTVKGSLQRSAISALVKEIDAIGDALKSMGLDNVEIVRGRGAALAGDLLGIADKTHTSLRNIVVMASIGTINSGSFDRLKNTDGNDKPFLAGINPAKLIDAYSQFGEDTSSQLRIRLMELLYMTLELAAGKEPPQIPVISFYDKNMRLVIFLPDASPMDYEVLRNTYAAEKTALSAA